MSSLTLVISHKMILQNAQLWLDMSNALAARIYLISVSCRKAYLQRKYSNNVKEYKAETGEIAPDGAFVLH